MKRRVLILALMVCAGALIVAPMSSAKGKGGPPVCPQIWAPVICDGGKIYPNQCEADRKHAKNCEPYDGL